MARRYGKAVFAAIATGVAAKTLVQLIAAANHAIAIREVAVGFSGVSNTDAPIRVDLIRQTDAGTMSALTLIKEDDSCGDTLDTTATHTATAEPAAGDVLCTWMVHPQTGLVVQFPAGEEPVVGAADRLGLRVTATVTVNASGHVKFEE